MFQSDSDIGRFSTIRKMRKEPQRKDNAWGGSSSILLIAKKIAIDILTTIRKSRYN